MTVAPLGTAGIRTTSSSSVCQEPPKSLLSPWIETSICFLFAEGAAFQEHGHKGEGEAGAGGDELGIPSRHPHHHPPLPHARGEGHQPAPRAATWPDKNRVKDVFYLL